MILVECRYHSCMTTSPSCTLRPSLAIFLIVFSLFFFFCLVFDGHTQTHTLHIPPPPPSPAALHSVCRPADKCSALQPLLSISCRNHVCAEEGIYCPELILLNRRWQRLDSPRRQHERVDNQTNTHK